MAIIGKFYEFEDGHFVFIRCGDMDLPEKLTYTEAIELKIQIEILGIGVQNDAPQPSGAEGGHDCGCPSRKPVSTTG